jgi:sugar-specific transcriptional regulator TrmB
VSPSRTDPISRATDILRARIAELQEELEQLRRALAELGPPAGHGRSRVPRAQQPPRAHPKKGTRVEQALAIIRAEPGITAKELASRLGIAPTAIYRTTAQLRQDGLIRKRGRALHPQP